MAIRPRGDIQYLGERKDYRFAEEFGVFEDDMSKEFKFFIYLLERYAEHLGVTADVAYRRLSEKNLVDYAVDMYELYHVEAIENAFADLDGKLI